MVTARLFDRSRDQDEAGLGDYEFELLPRRGEIIELHYKDSTKTYEVVKLEHIFFDQTKPPQIAFIVRPFGDKKQRPG